MASAPCEKAVVELHLMELHLMELTELHLSNLLESGVKTGMHECR